MSSATSLLPSRSPWFSRLLATRWGVIAILAIAYTLADIAWTYFKWGGPARATLINDLAALPPSLLVTAAACRAALAEPRGSRLRRAWFLVGLGLLSYFVGNVVWAYLVNVVHARPFPSLADVFYLGFYPCLFGSVWFFAERQPDRRQRVLIWLDLLSVFIAAAMFVGYFIVVPTAAATQPDLLTRVVAVAHAISSLMLIGAIGAVLYRRSQPEAQGALVFVLAGLIVFLASDFAFGYTGLAGTYAEGGWVDAGWNIAQLFFLLAAVRQLNRPQPAAALPPATAPRWRAELARLAPGAPFLAVCAAYALVIHVIVSEFSPAAGWLLAGAALITLLVLARQIVRPGFADVPIARKILLSLLIAVGFSVGLVTVASYLTLRTQLEAAVGATLKLEAQSQAQTIANNITQQHQVMQGFLFSYVLQDVATAANAVYPADDAAVAAILQRREAVWQTATVSDTLVSSILNGELAGHLRDFLQYFPGHNQALVTDRNGASLAASERLLHYWQAHEAWWQGAYRQGQGAVYISGPEAAPQGGLRMVFALPVRSGRSGPVAGVFWMTDSIQGVVSLLASSSGPDLEYDLLLPDGQLLTPNGGLQRLSAAAIEDLAAAAPTADAQLDLTGAVQLVSQAPVLTSDPEAAAAVRGLNWTVVARQAPAAAFAPVMAAGQTALLSTLLVLLVTVGLAVVVAPVLVAPLGRLTRVAEQIAAGDLSTRAQVDAHDEIGTLAGAFNTMLDGLRANIVEVNQARQALEESERRYRRLVNFFPDLVAVFRQGRVVFINPAGLKLLGAASLEELAPHSLFDFLLPQDRAMAEQGMARGRPGGEPSPLIELPIRRLDGSLFDAEFRVIPITYAGELALQFVMRDITERKQAEALVRQNAARAEALARVAATLNARLDLSAVMHAICEETARALNVPVVTVRLINEQADGLILASQVGRSPEHVPPFVPVSRQALEAMTLQPGASLVPAALIQVTDALNAALYTQLSLFHGASASLMHNRQLIGLLTLRTVGTAREFTPEDLALLKGLADQAALAISNARLFAEVTRQNDELEERVAQRTQQLGALNRQLESELAQRQDLLQSLSESEQRFRRLFDASPEAIMLIDPHDPAVVWRIIDCNQAACQMNGYAREELIGQPIDLLNVRKQSRADYAGSLEGMRQANGPLSAEVEHVRKDGRVFPIEYATLLVTIGERELVLGIDRDITERKQSETELKAAKELAEAASRAKSEFLSRMSHELRTPMNAILGFAQLLNLSRKDPLTPGQQQRVQQIVKGGQHLLDLINEILDLSRIEAGRLQVSPEPVRVMDALREVLDLTSPLAAGVDVEVHASLVADANPYVLADRQRLKQVLLNLISNAIKYNRPGGQVTVTCAPAAAGGWRLSVIDTGAGLSPEHLARLFVPFERLAADQSAVEGTGLGLALAKRLTELMQGAIGVESVVGAGSTFWVELPAAESQLEHLQRSEGTGPLPNLSPAARCILYIEDNPGNFELVHQVLADYTQVRLLWATEAEAGLTLARQQSPDLILLDLHLGPLDGAQVLAQLKGEAQTAAIPVVVVSADATAGQAERLRRLGALAYLTKPLNVKHFVSLVEEILDRPGA